MFFEIILKLLFMLVCMGLAAVTGIALTLAGITLQESMLIVIGGGVIYQL